MEERGITPVLNLPKHSVYMETDKVVIERIFQNLITNAIRYTTGNIAISMTSPKFEKFTLTVSNPIPEDSELDPNRMFERFYTGDSSRSHGGTGLDLAVVKEYTTRIGGEVDARINDGELVIELKLRADEA